MKKTENKVNLEGWVFQHTLESKVTGEKSKNPGTAYIGGTIDLAVDPEGLNVLTVRFPYVPPFDKSGKKKRTYDVLMELINHPEKTWQASGKEGAMKLAIDTSIGLNEFVNDEKIDENGEKELISAKVLEGGFATILTREPKEVGKSNFFRTDFLVTNIVEKEEDEERGTPRKLDLSGYVFNWQQEILPVTLTVQSDDGINYFLNNYDSVTKKTPELVVVTGTINSLLVTKEIKHETAFGASRIESVSRKVKSWVIDSADVPTGVFGDDGYMTAEEYEKKLADRKIKIAEIRQNHEDWIKQKDAPASAPTASRGSFVF